LDGPAETQRRRCDHCKRLAKRYNH